MAKTSGGETPWERKRPAGTKKTTLTPESRHKARTRARAAGRKYPNLVDNMWAATEQRKQKGGKKKAAAARKTGTTKRVAASKKTAGSKKTASKKTGGAKKKTGARKRAK
jgi:hypothetical protein